MDSTGRSGLDRVRALRYSSRYAPPQPTRSPNLAEKLSVYDAQYNGMATYIYELQHLYWTRQFNKLFSKLMGNDSPIHDLFDPEETQHLLNFVALGGLDAVCRILADTTLPYDQPRNLTTLYRVLIRLVTEVIIVNPAFAWYLVDAHYPTYQHLLRLLAVRRLRESVLSVFEHTVSAVGPAILLEKCPTFGEVFDSAEGLEIGFASRVVALLIVPSMAVDKSEREPFPQCLTRMAMIEGAIDSNARYVLDHPTLLKKLLGLIDPKYYKKFDRSTAPQSPHHGMFSMTPEGQLSLQIPAGWATSPEQAGMMQQLQQFIANMNAMAGANGGDPVANFDDDEYDVDDDDDDGVHDNDAAPAGGAAPAQAPPPNVVVTDLLEQAAADHEADQEQQPPSEITECAWFTGTGPPNDYLWRQRKIRIVEDKSTKVNRRFKKFADANAVAQHRSAKVDHTHLFNAQSEILFVLNTLLCTAYHRRAWSAMCQEAIMEKMRDCFPLLFTAPAAAASNANDGIDNEDLHDCDWMEPEDSPVVDTHNHDPPTLRKIELQRLLHEYWDAHDVDECVRILQTDSRNDRAVIAAMIAEHLRDHAEDVCVENLMCFSLEAYVRAHWFADRNKVQSEYKWIIRVLLKRLFPRTMGGSLPAFSSRTAAFRRIESTFTLTAELCKYNPGNWAEVGRIVRSYDLEDALVRAILNHTFETSFFLRSLLLSCYPQVRSQRGRGIATAQLVEMRRKRIQANPELEDIENSDQYARQCFETQQIVLSRMYHIRVVSERLASNRVTDPRTIYDALESAPAACGVDQRRRWLHDPHSCVPTCESPTSTAEAGEDEIQKGDVQDISAIAELPALWPKVSAAMPAIFRNLMGHLNSEDVESADHMCVVTTSVAVALTAYARGGREAVDNLVKDAVQLHHTERQAVLEAHEVKSTAAAARRGAGCTSSASRTQPVHDADDDAAFVERITHVQKTQSDGAHDASLCPNCRAPPTTVCKNSRLLCVNDLAANYYRVICAWLAHYQAQKNYFMTLFFCTEVDVPRWKRITEVLLEVLPAHFG
jgi:hypothetical protein